MDADGASAGGSTQVASSADAAIPTGPAVGGRALTIGLVMAVTVNAMEVVAVITAMPSVAKDLHGDRLYGAAFSAYMVANLVAIVIAGHMADRHGPARPFLMAAAIFSAGLVLAGTAPSMLVVVAARAVQGFGGGTLATVAYVGVGRGFPRHQQSRIFAFMSTAWVLPGLLAPVAAGAVAENLSWRYVFLGVLPLVALSLVLTLPALRRLGAPPGAGASTRSIRDRLTSIVPRGTFRAAPGLPAAIITRFCVSYGFFGTDTFIPLAATRIHHVGNVTAGLVITGATFTWTAGSWINTRWTTQRLPARIVGLGAVILTIGVTATASVALRSVPLWLIAGFWSIGGLGMGLAFTGLSVYTLALAPPGREGQVSSQLQVADAGAAALAGAVAGAIIAVASAFASLSSALLVVFATAALVTAAGRLSSRRLAS